MLWLLVLQLMHVAWTMCSYMTGLTTLPTCATVVLAAAFTSFLPLSLGLLGSLRVVPTIVFRMTRSIANLAWGSGCLGSTLTVVVVALVLVALPLLTLAALCLSLALALVPQSSHLVC